MVCTGYTFMICLENSLCRRRDMYFTNLRTACWNFCINYITQGWALLDLGIPIIEFNVLHDLCFFTEVSFKQEHEASLFQNSCCLCVCVCVCVNLEYNMLLIFKYLVTLKVTDFWVQIFYKNVTVFLFYVYTSSLPCFSLI